MRKLTDPAKIQSELRSTCDSSVIEMYEFWWILCARRSTPFKSVHQEVQGQQFFPCVRIKTNLSRNIISWLKSQAISCDFVRKCEYAYSNCGTSYSEDIMCPVYSTGHIKARYLVMWLNYDTPKTNWTTTYINFTTNDPFQTGYYVGNRRNHHPDPLWLSR